MLPRALSSCALLLLAACGGEVVADGGTDASTPDLAATDAGTDAGPPVHHELYGPCDADSDCPGVGAICRRNVDGWPQGYCTVPCADRTPCDDGLSYNHCLDDGTGHFFCERRCLNGIDCSRDGYSCQGNYPPADGKCIPVCADDAVCGAGAVCQHETGRCVAPGTPTPGGAAVGAPCTTNAGCRSGLCEPEVVRGAPTGFVHGSCLANCVLPSGFNPTTYFTSSDLPQATCGSGEVCIPTSSLAAGDLGACSTACRSNADCRAGEGYDCRLVVGPTTFSTGFCEPINCSLATCPTGYACTSTNICASI